MRRATPALVAGISVLTRAVLARHRPAAASAAGLAAIIAAAVSGAAFVSNGRAGASMAMAVLTGRPGPAFFRQSR